MKKIALLLLSFLLLIQGCGQLGSSINSSSATVEKPLFVCPPSRNKPTIAVMEFEVKAGYNARRKLGNGMSDMLVNALVESQCFRVMERSRIAAILKEQNLGRDGIVSASTAASVGQMIGAQLLVMGTVTEFDENESGGGVGAFLGRAVAGVGMKTAHVGLIVRIVDATTGEILVSKSVDKKVNKLGLAAGSLYGLGIGGGLYTSQAMQDAIEQTLIETAAIISQQRARLDNAVGISPIVRQQNVLSNSYQSTGLGKRVIRKIQENLTRLGYSPGTADGIMGGKTKSAIQLYQEDYNLPVNGKATRALLNSLKDN